MWTLMQISCTCTVAQPQVLRLPRRSSNFLSGVQTEKYVLRDPKQHYSYSFVAFKTFMEVQRNDERLTISELHG